MITPSESGTHLLIKVISIVVVCVAVIYGTAKVKKGKGAAATAASSPLVSNETQVKPPPIPEKPADGPKREFTDAELHSVENLGVALTKQFEATNLGVTVSGNDTEGWLRFDCSDDPHPEDVCFMLYKRYPDKDEIGLLWQMGIRTLYFSNGLLGKTWTKHL